jgi:hypothetical protein
MDDISKGVANTLYPTQKNIEREKNLLRKFEREKFVNFWPIFVKFANVGYRYVPERPERTVAPPPPAGAKTLDPCPAGGHASVPTPGRSVLCGGRRGLCPALPTSGPPLRRWVHLGFAPPNVQLPECRRACKQNVRFF